MLMSQNKYIQVMISSRNSTIFDQKQLSETRINLKKMIENENLFGKKMFKVWINEDEPPQSFDETIWDKCLKQVREADIVIVLYNGEAGWLRENDTIGICHGEVLEAVNVARGKVWGLTLNSTEKESYSAKEDKANARFKKFIEEQQLFSKSVNSVNSLENAVKNTLIDAVINLMSNGVREVSRNKGNHGESLIWKNMNYEKRSQSIIKSIKESIETKGTGFNDGKNYFLEFDNQKILVIVHAIPDTLSIASAREKVGQPFLHDFKMSDIFSADENIIGPLHIIGCHKSVTETQTRNILGFPDATILKDSFGIYVADNIQKIQMIFIEKCSDSHSIRLGFQSFLEWLNRTSEVDNLLLRSKSRKNIIITIANENHG